MSHPGDDPSADVESTTEPASLPEEEPYLLKRVEVDPSTDGVVEIVVRVPNVRTRVTLTIEIDPASDTVAAAVSSGETSKREKQPPLPELLAPPSIAPGLGQGPELAPLRIADGRPLPPLLFVTSRAALAQHLGIEATEHVLDAIVDAGHSLLGDVPVGISIEEATQAVRTILQENQQEVEGVVILGGYDVVPAQRLDTLAPDLRREVGEIIKDADNFIVWSDDAYGDADGDFIAELPVSRIPDGRSAALVWSALQARSPLQHDRFGIRNVKRPFAHDVFSALPGDRELLVSGPMTVTDSPEVPGSGCAYLMLHGRAVDGTTYWGEWDLPTQELAPEAFHLSQVPQTFSGIIFTGCCWGALPAAVPAAWIEPGQMVRGRTAGESIALSFLQAGAQGFVGCTGSHYSPVDAPYRYFGAPMHVYFWALVHDYGYPPARALFVAKQYYAQSMPHITGSLECTAVESKILRQFTCLGLGW